MNAQSLIRSSAVIYADNISSRKTETIKKKFIEAVFANNDNAPLTIDEIASALLTDFELVFGDQELLCIVHDEDVFSLQQFDHNSAHDKYNLTAKRFRFLQEKSTDSIDECIKQYLSEQDASEGKVDELKQLLESYLYSMMNSNIDAYKQVLGGNIGEIGKNVNGRVNPDDFTEEQVQSINDFLMWNNTAKDKELFKLVSYCIEYAIVSNNSSEQTLLRSFKNKILYLDNAFVYRAIGINGESRKKRTISFIQKCIESGQKLKITKFSREEFIRTIDHNIQQLNGTTPFGRINPKLFQKYCYGETIYQFYHNWRANRISYGFNSFKAYIQSEYNKLISSNGIEEDFRPPFDETAAEDQIEKYSNEIGVVKKRGSKLSHETDALNMYWVEKARDGNDGRMIDTKYYFITPDQKLQLWDSTHSKNQPITLLPSQWLALLLKFTSRSNDDYKSFVSFLRLSHNETDMTPESLQEILSGISEITEDLKQQSDFLDVYMEEEWRQMRTNKSNLREEAQRFAKNHQEKVFKQTLDQKAQEMAETLARQEQLSREQITAIEQRFKQQLKDQERKAEASNLQLKFDFTKQSLRSVQQQLDDNNKRKGKAGIELNRIFKLSKIGIILLALLLGSAWIYAIFKIGWDKMEVFTYVLGLLFTVASILYLIAYEKSFSLQRTITNFRQKQTARVFKKYGVSESVIEDLSQEAEALREEEKAIQARLSEFL